MKILFLSIVLSILSLSSLMAQDVSIRVSVIQSMADSAVPEQKMEALRSIEKILDENSMGSEEDNIINILSSLSSEGITNLSLDMGHILNDLPRIRLEAVRLLGKTGSPKAMNPLAKVVRYDDNITVLSVASLTAARLESADWSPLTPYFYQILKIQKQIYQNNQLIQDVLTAIGIIADRDETFLNDPIILEGIIYVAESELGLSKKTRNLAIDLSTRQAEK
ncbi:hypothetical protein [Oceanispirochaeta sp.]|jgi:hypothetical protein|uniref:hypothetical protein n=1 Tax=Oceanispirochaeta sp. TaxID=2035350 RepID=UPI0026101FCA|nr:hypothetical protein [Oceanispirochaeta sp.]MDA3956860.1 hypothetical protein [Oceanispirochaeta sp.]